MKDILFRAKTLGYKDYWLDDGETGEWVYGNYYLDECGVDCIAWYDKLEKTWNIREIDANTLSQFTGLLDCNGNKIFEDNILKKNILIMKKHI